MKLRVDIFLARALRWMSVSSGDELSCISSFSLFKAYCGGLSRRIFHVVIKNYRSTDQSPLKIRFTKKYLGFFKGNAEDTYNHFEKIVRWRKNRNESITSNHYIPIFEIQIWGKIQSFKWTQNDCF